MSILRKIRIQKKLVISLKCQESSIGKNSPHPCFALSHGFHCLEYFEVLPDAYSPVDPNTKAEIRIPLRTEVMNLRQANNEDADVIISLIDETYQKHGDKIWLEGYDSDLLDIEDNYFNNGGHFVVLEKNGTIIGTHATQPINLPEGLLTFRRLYLKPEYHGTEASHTLFKWAMDWAIKQQFKRVEFWSDTRYNRAHNFFKKYGFAKTGAIQHLEDAPDPYSEYQFFLDLPSGK